MLLSLLHLALVVLVFYKVISIFLLGSVVDVEFHINSISSGVFSLDAFISNASEDLSTPNSFPVPVGSRRYLGALADDVGVAPAEADTRGCGFVFGIARYLRSL